MSHRHPLLLLLLLLGSVFSPPRATGETETRSRSLAEWLESLQYASAAYPSFGAIRVHNSPAATGTDGQAYCRVSPYVGNLAALGLLRSGRPEAVPIAERWIEWFCAHLNAKSAPDGVPFEHFYLKDGSGETVCVKPGDPRLCRYNDATDSAAATFFSVLWAVEQQRDSPAANKRQARINGGQIKYAPMFADRMAATNKRAPLPGDVFTMAAIRDRVERLADVLLALQNPAGIPICRRSSGRICLE